MNITARIQITVELTVRGENWNEHTSVEQLHREGAELGVRRITDLCQRSVALIGRPEVQAIITNPKPR